MILIDGMEELNLVFKFSVHGFDYSIFESLDADKKHFKCGKTGHLVRVCPERQSDPGVSEQLGPDVAEPAGAVPSVFAAQPDAPYLLLHQSPKRVNLKPSLQPRSLLGLHQPQRGPACLNWLWRVPACLNWLRRGLAWLIKTPWILAQ